MHHTPSVIGSHSFWALGFHTCDCAWLLWFPGSWTANQAPVKTLDLPVVQAHYQGKCKGWHCTHRGLNVHPLAAGKREEGVKGIQANRTGDQHDAARGRGQLPPIFPQASLHGSNSWSCVHISHDAMQPPLHLAQKCHTSEVICHKQVESITTVSTAVLSPPPFWIPAL
jgi:hypothetical protein